VARAAGRDGKVVDGDSAVALVAQRNGRRRLV
jgi:hypothetical protein